jgi:hypothetical protein
MVQKMQLIIEVHRSLFKNVEHAQKKKKKTYVVHKALQTFDGFEANNIIKMHTLGKKKYLICN